MFEKLILLNVIIHVACGMLSLVVAPIAMIVKKGGQSHLLWGKVYFWGMTISTLTGLVAAYIKWIPFVMMLGFFSYFFLASGYRSLYLKKLHAGQRAGWLDWLIAIVGGSVSITFLVWGGSILIMGKDLIFSGVELIAIIFGLVILLSVIQQVKSFRHPPPEKYRWFLNHMDGMLSSYIGVVTAFTVLNLTLLPPIVRWLGPAAIAVPLITVWSNHYKRKFLTGRQPELVATVQPQPFSDVQATSF